MKNMMKNHLLVLLGSVAGTCLISTVVFANPSMLPDHPGYPMDAAKSPVSGVATANDPGKENLYGQKALNAATQEGNQEMNLRSRARLLEEEKMEEMKEKSGKSK